MEFIDEIKVKTMDMAQVGVAKSKQLVDLAKLNIANATEQENIKKAYAEIGRLYYAERGMAPETAYVSLCEKITTAKATIEHNKATMDELKGQPSEKPADVGSVVVDVPCEEAACATCDCGCDCAEEGAPADPNAEDYEVL